jgi:quercetin dioxygenase-like cupin family protein
MDITEVEKPRRIVSGIRADGSSYLARVEKVEEIDYRFNTPPAPAAPGAAGDRTYSGGSTRFFRIWGSDRLPIPLPTDGRAPFFEFGPSADETPEALRRSATCPPPLGLRVSWSKTVPGAVHPPPSRMHFTETTDLVFFMSGGHGEILEEGELILRAGDVFVQNGTMHSHEGVGDETTVIGWVLLGALSSGWTPPPERLHGVSGPLGGWRRGETREKEPMAPWTAPSPPPGSYPDRDRKPVPITELQRPRRVVSGTNAAGRSYYARVEEVEEIDYEALGRRPSGESGVQSWRLWQGDRLPDLLPTAGLTPPVKGQPGPEETPELLRRLPLEPDTLGYIATMSKIAPAGEQTPFHWHTSMDVIFMMAGELDYLLDGGDRISLRPGDVVIQNGTNHAWHNRGRVPAVLGTVSVGAAWFGPTPPREQHLGRRSG